MHTSRNNTEITPKFVVQCLTTNESRRVYRDTTIELTVACSSWRQWATPYHGCSHRGIVTNCRLQQQQRRGWNVWGVTSERQRQSRQNRQRHCSIAYVSIKKKTQNTKSPIVACSLLRWWQQCFAVWTNGQFQCKVLLFGGRWSCCLLLDNSVLPSLYPWQVEARKVTIRETTVNRPGRLDCITSISFQAEQV